MFNENEYKILKILKENEWISGEEVAKELGISRTAVWKCIKKIKSLGYEIVSVKNRGYKILSSSEFDPIVQLKYKSSDFCDEIIYLDETESTQEYAINELFKKKHNIIVIAGKQTKARGKKNSRWVSPEDGIYFSTGFATGTNFTDIHEIKIIIENSVITIISDYSDYETKIVNSDILLNGEKIGGILEEHFNEADMVKFLIFGIGIYTNSSPEGLSSLKRFGKKQINRWEITAGIIKEISKSMKKCALRESNPQPSDP